MRVSVIIPAYRAAKTIQRAIDSVLAQTAPAHEIIVIDDGSPDDQVEVIHRGYGERVILVRKSNGKTASARNAGIERATGDFIAFLDADDYWEPEKLEQQLAVFARHPEVGLVAGQYWEQEPGCERQPSASERLGGMTWDRIVRTSGADAFRLASLTWTGTVMIRREAIGNERFVSGLEPAEDRDFWVRILNAHPAHHISERLATYVLEAGSNSRSGIARDCTSMLEVVKRHRSLLGPLPTSEWKSHVLYRWAANDENPREAVPRLLKSFCLWPLPYIHCPNVRWLGRLKRLGVLTLIGLGLRRQPNAFPLPRNDDDKPQLSRGTRADDQ